MPLVYDELHRMALRYLAGERSNVSLQATALVNELCLRLLGWDQARWQNRGHFFGVSAQMMRRVLVDIARRRRANCRGGADAVHVPLESVDLPANEREMDLVAIDGALEQLASRILDGRVSSSSDSSAGCRWRKSRRPWVFRSVRAQRVGVRPRLAFSRPLEQRLPMSRHGGRAVSHLRRGAATHAEQTAFIARSCGTERAARGGESFSWKPMRTRAHSWSIGIRTARAGDGSGTLEPPGRHDHRSVHHRPTPGCGGAGEVWRASDDRLGRDVAIKVLLPHAAGDTDRLRRFAEEARAAGTLNHPTFSRSTTSASTTGSRTSFLSVSRAATCVSA